MTSMAVWIAADSSEVRIGDHVALDLGPDVVGVIAGVCPDRGRPEVRLTEGARVGKTVTVWPYQILLKVPRRGAPTAAVLDCHSAGCDAGESTGEARDDEVTKLA